MEWTQFIILVVTVGGLFFWNRSESNSDRREILTLIKAIESEMRDFHGRLCNLEGRKKIMEKVNKKIIDEESKTVTVVRDFETDAKVIKDAEERHYKDGFKNCLRTMSNFFKNKPTIYGNVETDFRKYLKDHTELCDLLWFDDVLEIIQSICEKEVEKAIQNKKED